MQVELQLTNRTLIFDLQPLIDFLNAKKSPRELAEMVELTFKSVNAESSEERSAVIQAIGLIFDSLHSASTPSSDQLTPAGSDQ